MWLTRLAVKQPIVILMAIAAILLMGVYGYAHMPTELDPQVDIAVVHIMTIYPGATPKQVEERLTRPLEEAVASINRVDGVDSTSFEHVSNVTVRFQEGTDPDVAAAEVKAKVESSRGDLPPEAAAPVISKVDLNAQPVMVLGVNFAEAPPGLTDERQIQQRLREQTEDLVKPKISQVPGVASVKVLGGVEREIEVRADPSLLQEHGLSVTDLASQIRGASQSIPAGQLTSDGHQTAVRYRAEFENIDQIREVDLYPSSASGGGAGMGGVPGMGGPPALPSPVAISEVAQVEDTYRDPDQIVRVGGKPGVIVLVQRSSDANTVQVADTLKSRTLPELDRTTRLRVWPLQDYSEGVRLALEDITGSLLLGSLLAILVVFVFLNSVKDTIIIAVAIPTSILATFGVMWLAGFTLNQMTMLALSLSVGILVDDSILVLDSIHRHRDVGKSPEDAALDGREEIGLADATNTLVDVVVFVPVALMGGVIGMYFKQFGLTVATATLFSMYVSFTLTPMLAAHWFGRGDSKPGKPNRFAAGFERSYQGVERRYRGWLGWAMRHRPLVVIAGFGSLGLALALAATRVGMDFVPSVDQGEVKILVEMPPGTTLDGTNRVMHRIEESLLRSNLRGEIEADRMYASVGEISGGADRMPERGPNFAELRLKLREHEGVADWLTAPFRDHQLRTRSDQEIATGIRELLEREELAPGAKLAVSAFRTVNSRNRSAITLTLLGTEGDEARLGGAANSIVTMFQRLGGPDGERLLENVDTTYRPGLPELSVEVDRQRARELRIPPAEIGLAIRTALEGSTDVGYRQGDHVYKVRVRVDPDTVRDPQALAGLIVAYRGDTPVTLEDVAAIRPSSGQTRILRRDRRPMVRVTADLAPGVDLGTAKDLAEQALKHLQDMQPIAWSPDGKTLAAGSWDGTIRLWDVASRQSRLLRGHQGGIWCLAWRPDGRTLASGSFDNTIRMWDPATGEATRVLTGHTGEVHALAWSPDGQRLVSGAGDRRGRVWDVASGRSLHELKGNGGSVSSVAWSSDGSRVATASDDGVVRTWDPSTGTLSGELRTGRVSQDVVTFQPRNGALATGGADGRVRLWKQGAQRASQEFRAHEGRVVSLAWSPDGAALASSGSDRTARIWDPASGQQRIAVRVSPHDQAAAIAAVAWSPDGATLAASSGTAQGGPRGEPTRLVRLFDAGTGRAQGLDLAAQPPHVEWGGDYSGMIDALSTAVWALVLAIALSYMLMAALFNSLLHPLTIMVSVPMALVGGVLALYVTGTSLSVVAMIGILMLAGLVSKNAILLVDYTNTLRKRGYERDQAILEAGPVRLRPILMTTIAMILGMLPVALRIGRAAEIRAPMAIVVIGGLVLSTLLTLIVIPVVYSYFDDITRWIVSLWVRIFRRREGEAEAVGDSRPAADPLPPAGVGPSLQGPLT